MERKEAKTIELYRTPAGVFKLVRCHVKELLNSEPPTNPKLWFLMAERVTGFHGELMLFGYKTKKEALEKINELMIGGGAVEAPPSSAFTGLAESPELRLVAAE